MVLDYSRFDNLDVSDDDAPKPVERYKGPSREASASTLEKLSSGNAKRAREAPRRRVSETTGRTWTTSLRATRLFSSPNNDTGGVYGGAACCGSCQSSLRRRGVVKELYADKPKDWRPAPERQFVNALMRRRKKAPARFREG